MVVPTHIHRQDQSLNTESVTVSGWLMVHLAQSPMRCLRRVSIRGFMHSPALLGMSENPSFLMLILQYLRQHHGRLAMALQGRSRRHQYHRYRRQAGHRTLGVTTKSVAFLS